MTLLLRKIDPELFETLTINQFGTADKPLFVAKDICRLLGYSNTSYTIKDIPSEYIRKFTITGNHCINVLTEEGVYWVFIRCNKPLNSKFQTWLIKNLTKQV